jgi:hypothetical protein
MNDASADPVEEELEKSNQSNNEEKELLPDHPHIDSR